MERILQRGGGRVQLKTSRQRSQSSAAAIRGLILTPTRELAAQCLGMMTAMAKFTGLRATLVVGGAKNVSSQVSTCCWFDGVQERLPICHGDLTFRFK
jgi:ATP-dependent RNA helicase DDX27